MTNNFEFDDFDAQVNCEEFYGNGPTEAELQEMMAEGDWEPEPMFPYDGEDIEGLKTTLRSMGFGIATFDDEGYMTIEW